MFIVDDILLFPVRGVAWIAKKVHELAEEEFENQAASTRAQLSDLYMRLETGELTEEEFGQQEKVLLDRLDEIESRGEEEPAHEEPATETIADVATVEHRTSTPEPEPREKDTQPPKKRTKAER